MVQRHTEATGGELSAATLWDLFSQTYLERASRVRYVSHRLLGQGKQQDLELVLEVDGQPLTLSGSGNGPIQAAIHALQAHGIQTEVRSYEERSIGDRQAGAGAQACAFVELAMPGIGSRCMAWAWTATSSPPRSKP